MTIEHKTFKFEVKEVNETTGEWGGYASVFRKEEDKVGDIVDPGAFSKTINDNEAEFASYFPPHDIKSPVGLVTVTEDAHGLKVKGQLTLGVQKANEALLLMKAGVIKTMSIGFDTIKAEFKNGIRHLKEIRLLDVSLVPGNLAADDMAVITYVKTDGKPYPNEHACRLRNPGDFQDGSFRRMTRQSDGKTYSIVMGRLKGETTLTEQAYRYDKDTWDADEARSHCEEHDGSFEAAEKQEKTGRVLSAASTSKIQAALDALKALLDLAEKEPEPFKDTPLSEAMKEAAELEGILGGIEAEMEGFDVKQAETRLDQILEKITLEVKENA